MGAPQIAQLGPFTGGLNLESDVSNIQDTELTECINFELDLDGSLIQRLPLIGIDSTPEDSPEVIFVGKALVAGIAYVIAANAESSAGGVYLFDGTTWTTICDSGSRCVLQYRDLLYVIATQDSPVDGGSYSIAGSAFTPVATIPRGESAVFAKGRLWVVPGVNATTNTARLTFSDPVIADLLTWSGTNIVDVHPGDGQKLVDVAVSNDNLMLFKQDSTWVFAFDLQPADAVLRSVNTTIGSSGFNCVVSYENSIFVYHKGNVYEIINYDFAQINVKVPFVLDADFELGSCLYCLSVVDTRLILRYFNKMYVYGLNTKTWSEWSSVSEQLNSVGPFVPLLVEVLNGLPVKYFSGAGTSIVYMPDQHSDSGIETLYNTDTEDFDNIVISSSIVTKTFDVSDPIHFKKLMWWGVDCLTTQNVVGIVTPVAIAHGVTWGQMASQTWGYWADRTWGNLMLETVTVETDASISNTAQRIFVKFLKTLRFRKIKFKVILTGDGSLASGPARIFTLSAILGSKQTVNKQVN